MNHPARFARFIWAVWTANGYRPGSTVSINPGHVQAFHPATGNDKEELNNVTDISMSSGYEFRVMLGYDQVALRFAEAYSNPLE